MKSSVPLVPIGALPGLHAAAHPEQAAVIIGDERLSWRKLDANASRRARALRTLGVRAGERVAIAAPNSFAFYESAFAIWRLGATPAILNARAPRAEQEPLLDLIKPAAIVTDDAALARDRPRLGLAAPEDSAPDQLESVAPAAHWKAMTSGGSTGRPKVILDAAPAVWRPGAVRLLQEPGDVVLNPGPLHHNAPFVSAFYALFSGGTVIDLVRFDAGRALAALVRHRVQWVNMVPTMMSRIWRLPDDVRAAADLSALRVFFHMGAPCPHWLKRAFIGWLGPERVFELYSGTEGQGATIISGSEWLERPGSVGRAVGRCRISILDPEGRELPPGETGEVFFLPERGPQSTYRYIGAEPRRQGDWESIGDLGHLDEDGYLYLADRRTDLILTGGSNVYPAEVEAAIEEIPGVLEAGVVGAPDDDLGQRVHAFVYAPGATIDAQTLIDALASRLARYKIPRSFTFVDAPLRDEAGKLRRAALAAEARARGGA
jgi:bile acid-coenzyme A ligase